MEGFSAERDTVKTGAQIVTGKSFIFSKVARIRYAGKYSLLVYFRLFRLRCQQANLKRGEFQYLSYIFFNTTTSGRIQDVAKPFASAQGRK